MQTISQMTTAEMIAEYNALTGKSIKKFSTRATGEKQLIKARMEAAAEKIGLDLEVVAEESPLIADVMKADDQAEEVQAEEVQAEEVQAEEVSAEDQVWEVPAKARKEKAAKATGGISEGVKASWKNAEVAAVRAKRDAVAVEGIGEFKSVAAAFKALNLPMQKHIKFRLELKAAGKANFGKYNFGIVSK